LCQAREEERLVSSSGEDLVLIHPPLRKSLPMEREVRGMEHINTITGISMSESLKHHLNQLTKTLVDKWNKQEEKTYGVNKGQLHYSERYEVRIDLENLRENQLSEYENAYSLPQGKEEADKHLLEAYKSVFDWEEQILLKTSFSVNPEDYLWDETIAESEEEVKQYLSGETEVIEPDGNDYEGGYYTDGENERKVEVEIINLRLKKKDKYQIILEVEENSTADKEFQSSKDVGFETIADDLKQLINHKCPYLNVVNAIQEKL